MSNKLNTDKTLRNFINKKRLITTKIANNTVNFFQGEVFDSQGAALGDRWKQSKRAKKDGGKTLQKTGAGKRSIKERILNDSNAVVYAKAKYMDYHQTGAGNNPLRRFMGNSIKLLKQNKTIIIKELAKL